MAPSRLFVAIVSLYHQFRRKYSNLQFARFIDRILLEAEKLPQRTFCTVYTHIVGQLFPGKHIIGNLKLMPPRPSNNKERESIESNRTKMSINHYFNTPKIN